MLLMGGAGRVDGCWTPTGHVMDMVRWNMHTSTLYSDYFENDGSHLPSGCCCVVPSFPPGWEYCSNPAITAWQAFEKNTHRYRRRRWVRTRVRDAGAKDRKVSQVLLPWTPNLIDSFLLLIPNWFLRSLQFPGSALSVLRVESLCTAIQCPH